MSPDHVCGGPDAPIENHIIRIARVHMNDYQHGARTIEMYRSIPERFEPVTDEGQELIAAALATLVDDGQLEVTDSSVETSLKDFGADVDHRGRDSRIDRPEAAEFGNGGPHEGPLGPVQFKF